MNKEIKIKYILQKLKESKALNQANHKLCAAEIIISL